MHAIVISPSICTERITAKQYRELLEAGGTQTAARRQTPEEDLHRACIDWATLQEVRYPPLRWLVHVPNGGKRSAAEAGKLKAMGVKAGYPDLVINRTSGMWRGLAVELKSETGRVSPAQADWLEMFVDEGYLVTVCRSVDQFVECALLYLNGKSLIGSRLAAFSRTSKRM